MSQLIYNVTISVQWAIHNAWLPWMQQEHMPEVAATGCFTATRLLRLMDVDETEGPTYAAQYTAASEADYNLYIEQYATEMREKGMALWGNQFIAFRTVMRVVN